MAMDVVGTLRQNRTEIKRRFGVKRLGVFGSYARGEEKETSDVDILVELSKPTFDGFIGLADYLEALLGKKVDLVTTKGLSPHIAPIVRREVVWCE